jgi:hypothetical protein
MHTALAVVRWDPQIRGALIVLTGALILCGSVYLLLSTNLGAKVGLLVAVAGLSGWMLLLNIIWLVGPLGNGPIGYKGEPNGWTVKEIVSGDLVSHSGVRAVGGFPDGWTVVKQGTPLYASAAPAADAVLAKPASSATTSSTAKSSFPPPFNTSQDYVDVSIYSKGGHDYLFNLFGYKVFWRLRHHQMYIKHQPHYVVVRVAPAVPSVTLAGAATTLPAADVTKPLVSVVMLRNVGSLRLPPILLGFGSLLIFGLTCENLHAREKEIRRRKAEEEAGGSGPPGGRTRELQPA